MLYPWSSFLLCRIIIDNWNWFLVEESLKVVVLLSKFYEPFWTIWCNDSGSYFISSSSHLNNFGAQLSHLSFSLHNICKLLAIFHLLSTVLLLFFITTNFIETLNLVQVIQQGIDFWIITLLEFTKGYFRGYKFLQIWVVLFVESPDRFPLHV